MCQSSRTQNAERHAYDGSDRSLDKNHCKDLRRRGTERHANAEFTNAPRDGVGSHTVNADDRKQERHYRETRDEHHAKDTRFVGCGENAGERAELHRNFGIDVPNDVANRGEQSFGFCGRANNDGKTSGNIWVLPIVDVNGRVRIGFNTLVADVSDDANDGKEARVAVHVSKLDGVTDGIPIRPLLGGERSADQSDVRSVKRIPAVKKAALQKRNPESLKVSLADHVIVGVAQARLIMK